MQDPDTYKQYVKEQISNFAAHFPDSQDYMIVYVTTQDPNKQKTQFKLRGSAFDRIKADFGAKSDLYAIGAIVYCAELFMRVVYAVLLWRRAGRWGGGGRGRGSI